MNIVTLELSSKLLETLLCRYYEMVGYAIKLKFSSYVHLPSVNQIFQYRHA